MGKPATKNMVKPQINFSPKTAQQSQLFHELKHNNLLIAIGPAGTGKTFTAAHKPLYGSLEDTLIGWY